jgi:RNA polymerase sigma factor (sigma-70 family)
VTREQQSEIFEVWIAAHAAILHHAVNAFASGEDRNDLMQEILLSIWKAIPTFRGGSQPSTFLYRVSHNAALSWKRNQAVAKRQIDWLPPSNQPNPALDLLYEKIRSFPPLDRSLLLLYLDELSYREIAEIHGISESLVGVRLLRARNRLMDAMKEDHNGPA